MTTGTLVFFSGKMGAGKSTKSRQMALEMNAVLISEDEWLASIYPNTIASLEDYVKYSSRLKPQVKKLAQSILAAGTNVVMDYPANTLSQRAWFRQIFSELNAPHRLIYIEASDAVCLEQIEKRRQSQPERFATDTPALFEQVMKHFVEPSSDEGFNITRISLQQSG